MKQEHVLRVNNLKLKPDHSKEQLLLMLKKTLGLKNEYQIEYDVVKRSIDARHKPYIMYVYSVDEFLFYRISFHQKTALHISII